jgi:hypothetical protein
MLVAMPVASESLPKRSECKQRGRKILSHYIHSLVRKSNLFYVDLNIVLMQAESMHELKQHAE